ncbi:bidirectional sugar transporter SWEET13-like [Impatiens glandulifera]|uniref:bidirectional sugar transporter SWEET13-like n=1 Tax=Impatiens glandulifera TaxID=253017 RepID=UPI001FB0CD0B|nr:bidirectional sugar transporter SWEET13-like [Impatiens glandulifera]
MFSIQNPWIFTFGVLGNIVAFMVYVSPLPTFRRIIKKKSTEGFQCFPYLIALLSCMLWVYYACNKQTKDYLLISINSLGFIIEGIYIALYVTYAPRKAKVSTLKLLMLLNFMGFSSIVLCCTFLANDSNRVHVLGWICLSFSISVFAAPLSIIRQVIKTRSVEFMPFPLSFFLTLNAIMWFFYGFLQKDLYITLPNILGLIFGIVQMVIYIMYKKCIKGIVEEHELPTVQKHNISPISASDPICFSPEETERGQMP